MNSRGDDRFNKITEIAGSSIQLIFYNYYGIKIALLRHRVIELMNNKFFASPGESIRESLLLKCNNPVQLTTYFTGKR